MYCLSAGDLHLGGSSKDSGTRETVTLKWCTPRTNSVGECAAGTVQVCFCRLYLIIHIYKNNNNVPLLYSVPELHYCTGAYRISPVDVNSRPSSCLTNFLLNGMSDFLTVFVVDDFYVKKK